MTSQVLRSFGELDTIARDPSAPVVTLFSGGLDSSYLLHRLVRAGARNVHAVSVDLGEDESGEHKQRIADRLGVRLHLLDGRQEFAEDYVRPAIAAHAVYLDTHPVSSTLSRPLIAKLALATARELGATTVLHTANRSQNTLRRLNGAIGLLGFAGRYGSPYDLDPVDREQKMRELKEVGLDQLSERLVSGDSNLWCREFESGILDDPEDHAVPEELYRWSALRPAGAPETVEVAFEAGRPVAVDGRPLPLTELIDTLNHLVGAHGLGRYSGLEHLDHGSKVLEIREMPAAWLLLRSRRHLETATLAAELLREKLHQEQLWVREALEGRWFGELRQAAQAFIDVCSAPVTGSVRWRLAAGSAETRAIVADRPRYLRDREAWEHHSVAAERAAFTPIRPQEQ
ncbi:argininosuccinate synthase-related protein [Kitasatospora aureofaciens]|uniref:argininosuccinate synthase-related protein n=1 Tax=Kitasatospora aureofaciens TaxID=1894 RepID=UPI0005278D66|nr:argininosuccinate synthase-related protein [Kitasatospora aureofaciens]